MSNRFAVIRTASYNGSFRNAVDKVQEPTREGTTLYVRRIEKSRQRSTYGMTLVKITGDLTKALTWATRETAERKAAEHSDDYNTYAVVEVEVVESYPYDRPDAANRHAVEVRGAVRRDGETWQVLRKVGA